MRETFELSLHGDYNENNASIDFSTLIHRLLNIIAQSFSPFNGQIQKKCKHFLNFNSI